MLETLKDLFELIETLAKNKHYGPLELKFEAGNIVYCFKGESIKTTIKRNDLIISEKL